jgi:hypothetical protein
MNLNGFERIWKRLYFLIFPDLSRFEIGSKSLRVFECFLKGVVWILIEAELSFKEF